MLICRLTTCEENGTTGMAVRHIRFNGNEIGLAVHRDSACALLHGRNCLAESSMPPMRQLRYMVPCIYFMVPKLEKNIENVRMGDL
jgi:hypothetical protein